MPLPFSLVKHFDKFPGYLLLGSLIIHNTHAEKQEKTIALRELNT